MSVVDHIIRLDYTPIFDLFPPSAYEVGRGIYISESGDVSSKRRKALPPFPVDYATWSEAADVLFQIRDDHHPELRESNKAYKAFIRQRFKEWNCIAVWRWDSLWRQEAARLKIPFSPPSMDFWSLHFPSISQMGTGKPGSLKGCFLCPSEYHTASVCPLRSLMFIPDSVELSTQPAVHSYRSQLGGGFSRRRGAPAIPQRQSSSHSLPYSRPKSAGTRPAPSPRVIGTCDFFNLPRGCKKKDCNYIHRCARCDATTHSMSNCTK